MDDVVAHGTTLMCSAARSSGRAGAGAPSNNARAAVVLGNAMTSRIEAAPTMSITVRSNPTANPPWGGAPAASAVNRKPKRASMSAGDSPRCAKTLRCMAGSVMRIDPAMQRKVFAHLGLSPADIEARFGFLLTALAAGAPPHGGFAVGFDRTAMLLAGAASLRDVIAVPKTTAARALFEGAPTPARPEDLAALHIKVVPPHE